jgi:hypothetical protein
MRELVVGLGVATGVSAARINGRKLDGVGTLTGGGVDVVVVKTVDVEVRILVEVVAEGVTVIVSWVTLVIRRVFVVVTEEYQVGTPAEPVGSGLYQ